MKKTIIIFILFSILIFPSCTSSDPGTSPPVETEAVPDERYTEYMDAYADYLNGNYDIAREKFEFLGDYLDSKGLAEECQLIMDVDAMLSSAEEGNTDDMLALYDKLNEGKEGASEVREALIGGD